MIFHHSFTHTRTPCLWAFKGKRPAVCFFTQDQVILYYFLCFLGGQESWDDWRSGSTAKPNSGVYLWTSVGRAGATPSTPTHWRLLLRGETGGSGDWRSVYCMFVLWWGWGGGYSMGVYRSSFIRGKKKKKWKIARRGRRIVVESERMKEILRKRQGGGGCWEDFYHSKQRQGYLPSLDPHPPASERK